MTSDLTAIRARLWELETALTAARVSTANICGTIRTLRAQLAALESEKPPAKIGYGWNMNDRPGESSDARPSPEDGRGSASVSESTTAHAMERSPDVAETSVEHAARTGVSFETERVTKDELAEWERYPHSADYLSGVNVRRLIREVRELQAALASAQADAERWRGLVVLWRDEELELQNTGRDEFGVIGGAWFYWASTPEQAIDRAIRARQGEE